MVIARLNALDASGINILLVFLEYRIINGFQRHIVEHLSALYHQILA